MLDVDWHCWMPMANVGSFDVAAAAYGCISICNGTYPANACAVAMTATSTSYISEVSSSDVNVVHQRGQQRRWQQRRRRSVSRAATTAVSCNDSNVRAIAASSTSTSYISDGSSNDGSDSNERTYGSGVLMIVNDVDVLI